LVFAQPVTNTNAFSVAVTVNPSNQAEEHSDAPTSPTDLVNPTMHDVAPLTTGSGFNARPAELARTGKKGRELPAEPPGALNSSPRSAAS
jgi:hypothetical protein